VLPGFGSTESAIELAAGLALVVVAADWALSSGSVKLLSLGHLLCSWFCRLKE
jgi:hypothetical protein